MIDLSKPHHPTPSEIMTLLHWILMTTAGSVLACEGLENVEWWAVPAEQWHQRFAPVG